MTNKCYPDTIPRKRDKHGVWRQQYRGAASAILLQEEVEHLQGLLDDLFGHEELTESLSGEIEGLQDQVNAIAANGVRRMNEMHTILGAYELHPNGELSKADSEKVDYSNYRSPYAPPLELVRSDK